MIQTLEALKHLLWPTRCASCHVLLAEPSSLLCMECSTQVAQAPQAPLPPHIDAAMSLFKYEGAVQSMISKWKYHEDYTAQKAILSFVPDHMDRLRSFIPADVCMIPVPPHPKRLRERGFDPVWTFASRLHRHLEKAEIPTDFRDDVLTRTRHTAHQAALNHEQRLHNLDGAFKVKYGFKSQRVLLIDDVMTTGSTGSACAQVLKEAGVEWVGFLTLAYTAKS